jgi:hypothetical protein
MDNNNVRAAVNKRLKKEPGQFSFNEVIDPIEKAIERMQENVTSDLKQLEDQMWAIVSYWAAKKGKLINCRGCGEEFDLVELFRCPYCESYFCHECAKTHFTIHSLKIAGAA